MTERKRVVIVGGGITGLTAAYYLQKEARENQLPIDIVLVEGSATLGGKIETVKRDGYVIERGPDSFLIRKKSMEQLATEVGLQQDLVRNATGQAYVLLHDELHPIPEGSVMGVPTDLQAFVKTGLFSLTGKLRAIGDFFIPRSAIKGDQPVGTFFRRRFGKEVVDNLIEPLLSGVYAGDIDKMSLKSTFPQFYEVEKQHRSLILGMKKGQPKAGPTKNSHSSKKVGAFYTFRNGLQSLVERLEEELTDVTIRKETQVAAITHHALTGDEVDVVFSSGEKMRADAVILTTGHKMATQLFKRHRLLEELDEIQTTSVATVALAFPEGAVEQTVDGTGFLVSRASKYSITACTWTHRKWPTSTPAGKVLLRAFVGRVGEEEIVDLSDEEIVQLVMQDLSQILSIDCQPDFSIVTRFKEDRPQYRVGHQQRIERARRELEDHFPRVHLAGASYDGVGLPDCVDQGRAAVSHVLQQLSY